MQIAVADVFCWMECTGMSVPICMHTAHSAQLKKGRPQENRGVMQLGPSLQSPSIAVKPAGTCKALAVSVGGGQTVETDDRYDCAV